MPLDSLASVPIRYSFFFFFNDTATTEIYTLSLHDALPISGGYDFEASLGRVLGGLGLDALRAREVRTLSGGERSEEHTSELQSQSNIVCRLLLEKKTLLSSTAQTSSSRLRRSHTPDTPKTI